MYQPLVPCPGCKRHVRASLDHEACPFCGATVSAAHAPPDVRARLSRGALFVVAAAGVAIAGCSSDDTKTSGADTGVASDTSVTDTGGPVAAYGGPPDTGSLDSSATDGSVDDTGGAGPKYGAPPPPDSGTD